jgi:hypothetical protein
MLMLTTAAALEAFVADPQNDAVPVRCRTALAPAVASASAAKFAGGATLSVDWLKLIFAAWVGAGSEVSQIFSRSGVPYYAIEMRQCAGSHDLNPPR